MREENKKLQKVIKSLFLDNTSLDRSIYEISNFKCMTSIFFQIEQKLKNILKKKIINNNIQAHLKKKSKILLYEELNRQFENFDKSIELRQKIEDIYQSTLKKISFNQKIISIGNKVDSERIVDTVNLCELFKNTFRSKINNVFEQCPKFLTYEYTNNILQYVLIDDNFSIDDIKDPNDLNSKIQDVNGIFKQIQLTNTLPITLNADYFTLFFLSNISYWKKYDNYAFDYVFEHFSEFKYMFYLDEGFEQVMSFYTSEENEVIYEINKFKKKLKTEELLPIICCFTLLFNSIIKIIKGNSISFVKEEFVINSRSKQMLYNFIRVIASESIPYWYHIVAFIQGPLIYDIIKPFSYHNNGIIPLNEILSLLNQSVLGYNYNDFIVEKRVERSKFEILNYINDIIKKDNDISTIYLKALKVNNYSTTCNIFISGFLSEDNELSKNWKFIMNSIMKNEVCYFYNWPSQTTLLVTIRTILSLISRFFMSSNKNELKQQFLISKKSSKNAGKNLAYILASRTVFKYQTVNLIGFSLGVNVIKNCIKEMYVIDTEIQIPCADIIQNILMLGGATVIRKEKRKKYANYFNKISSGRVINCFSEQDEVLNKLFTFATNKEPIGNKRLDLPLAKLENYDFTDMDLGHLDYHKNMDEIIKIISFNS